MAVPSPASPRRIDAVTSAYVQQDKPADARGSSGPAQPRAAGNERPEQSGRAAPWSGSLGAHCEGRISSLKRGYGWDRTRLDRTEGARIWTGQGVFAHNLLKIRALAS